MSDRVFVRSSNVNAIESYSGLAAMLNRHENILQCILSAHTDVVKRLEMITSLLQVPAPAPSEFSVFGLPTIARIPSRAVPIKYPDTKTEIALSIIRCEHCNDQVFNRKHRLCEPCFEKKSLEAASIKKRRKVEESTRKCGNTNCNNLISLGEKFSQCHECWERSKKRCTLCDKALSRTFNTYSVCVDCKHRYEGMRSGGNRRNGNLWQFTVQSGFYGRRYAKSGKFELVQDQGQAELDWEFLTSYQAEFTADEIRLRNIRHSKSIQKESDRETRVERSTYKHVEKLAYEMFPSCSDIIRRVNTNDFNPEVQPEVDIQIVDPLNYPVSDGSSHKSIIEVTGLTTTDVSMSDESKFSSDCTELPSKPYKAVPSYTLGGTTFYNIESEVSHLPPVHEDSREETTVPLDTVAASDVSQGVETCILPSNNGQPYAVTNRCLEPTTAAVPQVPHNARESCSRLVEIMPEAEDQSTKPSAPLSINTVRVSNCAKSSKALETHAQVFIPLPSPKHIVVPKVIQLQKSEIGSDGIPKLLTSAVSLPSTITPVRPEVSQNKPKIRAAEKNPSPVVPKTSPKVAKSTKKQSSSSDEEPEVFLDFTPITAVKGASTPAPPAVKIKPIGCYKHSFVPQMKAFYAPEVFCGPDCEGCVLANAPNVFLANAPPITAVKGAPVPSTVKTVVSSPAFFAQGLKQPSAPATVKITVPTPSLPPLPESDSDASSKKVTFASTDYRLKEPPKTPEAVVDVACWKHSKPNAKCGGCKTISWATHGLEADRKKSKKGFFL